MDDRPQTTDDRRQTTDHKLLTIAETAEDAEKGL